jgi:hypothetical protein
MEQPILPLTDTYKKYYQAIGPLLADKKTKNYSTVIFFFLVLSVFGWYAIRPTIQTILTLRREIKDKTEISKKMDEKINALIQANSAYELALPTLPLLAGAVPKNPDVIQLVGRIKDIANRSGASVSAIQVSQVPLASSSAAPKKTSGAAEVSQTIPVSVTLTGTYPDITSFFTNTTDLLRIISIESLQFSGNQKAVSSTVSASMPLKVTVRLVSYYQGM